VDDWGFYYSYITIYDPGVFDNGTLPKMDVQLWDDEKQIWSAPDKFQWYITAGILVITQYGSYNLNSLTATKAKITFY
jgi:hypothetical protein